ncbi:MAG: glycine cleavage system protein R [Acidobacteria bacterium]|nr:glycine cleavage system protein R [Acidobacteriota bacterium]MCI0626264.1 glycine cleavage system protein R [Acidobacteriota bacterium]MCI0722984.1 glycine cleavage system protein R [Acidobacteriota bacterium]
MPNRENLILTAVGPDKVGLVEKISEFIVQHGCNIEDSKMAVFCGEFALILLISGEASNLLKLANAYGELGALTGLNISVRKPAAKKAAEQSLPYKLTASCMDHPGVVHRLSGLLSQLNINIEAMETKTYLAPVSGTPIFRMEAVLSVPAALNINRLRHQFGEIEREENIDIDLMLME